MKLNLCRSVPAFAIFTVVLLIGACGGDSGSSTTPVTTTTSIAGPSQASITVAVLDWGGIATGQGNLVGFDLRVRESAGLGANINFIRLEIYRATGQFEERQEIGSADIVQQTGSNRIAASATRDMTVLFTFNAAVVRTKNMVLTMGFTDDKGNNLTATFEWVL